MTSVMGLRLAADEFIARYEPGPQYGPDWPAVVDLLTRSTADRIVVERYRHQLAATGTCTPEVWVKLSDSTHGQRVGSGEHQVVAALLEKTEVPYYLSPVKDPAP